jgi:galactonate dehydratase
MAEPYNILVSPHNYNGTAVGLAATAQASVVIGNFLIAELFLNVKAVCDDIMTEPLALDKGFLDLTGKPGIGVDIDLEKIKKYPFKTIKKEFPVKGVAHYADEYPKKEDFVVG